MDTEGDNIFERRFQNRLEDLSRVTGEAVEFMQKHAIDQQAAYLANLAIEELVTNLLKYGYGDSAVHEILLRVEVQPGALLLVLEDDGRAFNPLGAPEPDLNQPAEQRALGGLGIHLVRKLVDQIEYERRGDRNLLAVKIYRQRPPTQM